MKKCIWLQISPIILVLLMLNGCETFDNLIGQKPPPPLPGERIPIMIHERDNTADPRISDLRVVLPPPKLNRDWVQSGGSPAHVMHHLKINKSISYLWTADAGEGSEQDRRLLASPIVVGERVFVTDLESKVTAFDVKTGNRIWYFRPKVPSRDEEAFGGGLAFGNKTVFLSTGYGLVYALAEKTGELRWKKKLPGPMRAPPSFADSRVFVVTIDNQLIALDASNGERLWSHAGLAEIAGLLGGAAPAVDSNTVVVPYSSGEVFAIRAANGRVAWSEALSPARRIDALATIAHVRGSPVINRGLVHAISHSGRLVAIDQRSGARVWERNIGGVETPWVAGDFIYVISNQAEIYCLTRRGGRIKWIRPLPRFEDPRDKEGIIKWSGPVLVSDRLVVTGSHGEALSISPYTGEPLGRVELPSGISIAPVVAGGTLYFFTNKAELIA